MPHAAPVVDALLRMPEVSHALGRSKWTVYDDIRAGLFTRPVRVGKRASAWPASEVAAVNRARVKGADENALRALVAALHEQRATTPGA